MILFKLTSLFQLQAGEINSMPTMLSKRKTWEKFLVFVEVYGTVSVMLQLPWPPLPTTLPSNVHIAVLLYDVVILCWPKSPLHSLSQLSNIW